MASATAVVAANQQQIMNINRKYLLCVSQLVCMANQKELTSHGFNSKTLKISKINGERNQSQYKRYIYTCS